MQEGLKPEHKMRPGWMLKADPELKAKVDANKKKYKEFKKLVGTKPVKEEVISEGAYEKAEENKKSADSAKKQGDMFAHHLHMADHHENMSEWHSSKGRHGEADKHASKAEEHHEKAMSLKEETLDESMTDSWKKIQSMDKGSVTGGKEEAKKRHTYLTAVHDHHKKFGNDTKKVKKELESLNRSRVAEGHVPDHSGVLNKKDSATMGKLAALMAKEKAAKAAKKPVKEETELDEAAKGHTMEAHGIKGMKRTPWRKSFKSHEHASEWADKNDAEIHGTRDLEKAKKVQEDVEHIDEATPYYNKPSFLKKMGRVAKQERLAREKKEAEAKKTVKEDLNERRREDDEYHVPDPVDNRETHTIRMKLSKDGGEVQHKQMNVKTIHGAEHAKKFAHAEAKKQGWTVHEEVEHIEERNKENATKRKMMDASRGAKYKLNNPVPDRGAEHKTAQAHNKAIGRALRNEQTEEEEMQEGLDMKKASMGQVIDDFADSNAPQFRGKSGEKRRQMAIAAKLKGERTVKEETINSFKSYLEEDLDEAAWPGTPEYKAKYGNSTSRGKVGSQSHGAKGTSTVTATGVKHERNYEKAEKETGETEKQEKRGRGRPKGSASGARQKGSAAKGDNSKADYTGFKLHLPSRN